MMSAERVVYSIQKTYILKPVVKPKKSIITCDQRIDIPTIEPLIDLLPVVSNELLNTAVPCVEIAGIGLGDVDLTFETNEGITVLPVKIAPGTPEPLENPHINYRYVLVLPRGTTGIKTCKATVHETGEEVQHNFTFGIMPPPYNYDNALFGYLSDKVNALKLTTKTPNFASIDLPKGAGKQTINIEDGVLHYETAFAYPFSAETTIHKPKITLNGAGRDFVYTLSLELPLSEVLIDLLAGMITVFDLDTGEIMQQFKLVNPPNGFSTLSFENFNDIHGNVLHVIPTGARVL